MLPHPSEIIDFKIYHPDENHKEKFEDQNNQKLYYEKIYSQFFQDFKNEAKELFEKIIENKENNYYGTSDEFVLVLITKDKIIPYSSYKIKKTTYSTLSSKELEFIYSPNLSFFTSLKAVKDFFNYIQNKERYNIAKNLMEFLFYTINKKNIENFLSNEIFLYLEQDNIKSSNEELKFTTGTNNKENTFKIKKCIKTLSFQNRKNFWSLVDYIAKIKNPETQENWGSINFSILCNKEKIFIDQHKIFLTSHDILKYIKTYENPNYLQSLIEKYNL